MMLGLSSMSTRVKCVSTIAAKVRPLSEFAPTHTNGDVDHSSTAEEVR